MKNRTKLSAAILMLSIIQTNSFAMVVYDPVNDADLVKEISNSITQIANQESQIANQVTSIQNQIEMLKENPFKTIVDYQNTASNISNIAQYGQAITSETQDLESTFQNRFGEMPEEQAFDEYNNSLNQTTLDTMQGSLQALHEHMQSIADQTNTINSISQQNNDLGGMTAQLQGISHLMNEQATQLQAIQQLEAEQAAQEATYIAAETAKEVQETKADTDWMAYEVEYPVYSDNEQLEFIPSM